MGHIGHMGHGIGIRGLLLGATLFVVAGCSESTAVQPEATTSAESFAAGSTAPDAASTSAQRGAQETENPAPLTPYAPGDELETNAEGAVESAWISRRLMNADRIEIQWNAPEGAAQYQIHRVPNIDDSRPDESAMTVDNQIHSGEQSGVFLDETVAEGDRYWYGVRGLDGDGALLSAGWHRAAAVTDEEPPSPVELSMAIEDGAILLTWDIPEENYELDGYRVLRAVDDEEPEVISTTWTIDQTSFVDNDPPKTRVTYSVEAFDFHWNDSTVTTVVVELS